MMRRFEKSKAMPLDTFAQAVVFDSEGLREVFAAFAKGLRMAIAMITATRAL